MSAFDRQAARERCDAVWPGAWPGDARQVRWIGHARTDLPAALDLLDEKDLEALEQRRLYEVLRETTREYEEEVISLGNRGREKDREIAQLRTELAEKEHRHVYAGTCGPDGFTGICVCGKQYKVGES